MVNDPFFSIAISKKPLFLSLFIFLFILLSFLENNFFYFNIFPKYSSKLIYLACITTTISMILCILYSNYYGNISFENSVIKQCHLWLFLKPNELPTIWLKEYLFSDENENDTQIKKYCDNRCTGAGELLLGLSIFWFFFQCIILYIFLQEDEFKDLTNSIPLTPNQLYQ